MKRKLFAALLALLMLTGCGTSAQPKADTSAPDAGESSQVMPEESIAETLPEASEVSAVEETEPEPAPEEPEEMPGPMLTLEDIHALEPEAILTEEELAGCEIGDFFYAEKISDSVFSRMEGISFGKNCTTERSTLRYVRVLHVGFDDETHVGELVVNKSIAADMLEIFRELYDNGYPIERMQLVDDYGGDDETSMQANNTSCFNFRTVAGSTTVSRHGMGLAIDVNPLYNPCVSSKGIQPATAGDYTDRSKDTPYKIDANDLCYKLFEEHGFAWGGWWKSVKDYQHFEK